MAKQPIIAHWGSPDPALAEGSDVDIYRAFKQVGLEMRRRVELFTSLPLTR